MNSLFKTLTLLLFLSASQILLAQDEKERQAYWTFELAKAHAEAQQNPQKWDQELLAEDLEYLEADDNTLPIYAGTFPVAPYDTPGTGGSKTTYVKMGDNTFISKSFIVKKGEHNQPFMGENQLQEVYFTYVLLTDFIDTLNYTHAYTYAESRNHPHYLCEGTLKTHNQNIDFLAMMTGDRNNYAVINMRFFDLRFGQCILIAPQKDGSTRFMQIKSPGLNSLTASTYVKKLLKQKEVMSFFEQPGNI
ncbi:MAG: hypothetical protein AAF696_19245 [Bacteroidota bacterium]